MFDFAHMAGNGILRWNIQFTFSVFRPLAIVIQETHRKDFYKRKQETLLE